jgi:hypothetical protein
MNKQTVILNRTNAFNFKTKSVITSLSIIIISLFLVTNSFSQTNTSAKNIIYLDVGIFFWGDATALGAGLNYERMLSDNVSLRGGINFGIFGAGRSGDAVAGWGIGFPVSINYMTNNKNKFEIGGGAGPYLSLSNSNKIKILPTVRIGYRYQPDEPGMMYRAGLEFPSNFYISLAGIGYHFK